ncbi:hypothetical protein JMA_32680 [Jeotgalibacillus malaysiensis]|uniref:t-SNARE coiled-coil homology domain-containing protein n=1 Tax=Jeotgalibacillus malaysiensis TaxID=1508404 RepID=A0A0B5AQN9_9BACL|nr:hypothetical protein [Jeotgalibacillus malaysiensis]AJD92585.1 hypothetical protein JMA_32680 [Jeotgalibacillus malaysiensis]
MEKEILVILQDMQGELKEIKTDLREFKQQVEERFVEVDTRFDKVDTQLHRIEYENQHAILSMLKIQDKKHEEQHQNFDYLLHKHIELDKDFHTFKKQSQN